MYDAGLVLPWLPLSTLAPSGVLSTNNVNLGYPAAIDPSYGRLEIGINGPAVGSDYGQLNVTGTVTLQQIDLAVTLSPAYTPSIGQSFVIVANDDTDAVSGAFHNAPEGAVVATSATVALQISYVGGTGNDIVLTAINNAPADTATQTPGNTATGSPTGTPTASPTPAPSNTPPADGPAGPCGTTPQDTCDTPTKGLLNVNLSSNSHRNSLLWKWQNTAPTTLARFGNPTADTSYSLCIYDYTASVPGAAVGAPVAAGGICGRRSCWRASGTRGFEYRNAADPHGITHLALELGATGLPKIEIDGRGADLRLPPPVSADQMLHQDPKVTVQLVNSLGNCWSLEFPAPARKDMPAHFRATLP